jgi:hemoglobin
MKKPLFLALALGIFLSACASTSTKSQGTLYQQLGGEPGVAKLVDALLVKYRADNRINGLFNETNFDYFRERLIEDICQRAGGGCVYQGLSMQEAHSGMAIKESEFNYFVEDAQIVMSDLRIPMETQNALLKLLAHDRADVINQ